APVSDPELPRRACRRADRRRLRAARAGRAPLAVLRHELHDLARGGFAGGRRDRRRQRDTRRDGLTSCGAILRPPLPRAAGRRLSSAPRAAPLLTALVPLRLPLPPPALRPSRPPR